MTVSYKPAGHQAAIPHLVVPDADRALEFLGRVFQARELHVTRNASGRVRHATVTIADSVIMLGEGSPQWPAVPSHVFVYVPDVDATYQRALAAGAVSLMQPAAQIWGDRDCGVKDSNDITWWIGTHLEDVAPSELDRRLAAKVNQRVQAHV